MRRNLAMRAQYYLASRQQDRRRAMVLRCLAVIVAVATAYALVMPAITQSNALLCGQEAHTHTEDCWTVELVAPQPELICTAGQNGEIVVHTHDSSCYDRNGQLICSLPEQELHTHNSDCYWERRELICEEPQVLGHTHSSSCYTYMRGELTCSLEEEAGHTHTDACWSIERSSTPDCGQTEGGHTHTSACYKVERGDTLDCGLEEEEGHTHSRACYTVERSSTPDCGQKEGPDVLDEEGAVIESGHTHSSACYPEEEILTCSLSESRGHSHSDACYPKEKTLICTLDEGQGHTHTDACYPEEKTLICQEEDQGHAHSDSCYDWYQELRCQKAEREAGHVHTDECYEITELLSCREEELILHAHTEDCYSYDEETEEEELVCTKLEVISHQHTSQCFHTPEGGPVETAVLTCGEEEHIHTEECYVEIVPKEEDIYFCGQVEHIHNDDCYFESGALRCTLTEHVHSLTCTKEPPEELEIPDELPEQKPVSLELDDYFDYESDVFHATFHITGTAVLSPTADTAPPAYDDDEMFSQPGGADTTEPGTDAADDASGGRNNNENAPQQPDSPDKADTKPDSDVADRETGSADESDSVESGDIQVPLADGPDNSSSSDEPASSSSSGSSSTESDNRSNEPAAGTVEIEFQVNELDESSYEYQIAAFTDPEAEMEQMVLSVLTFSVTASDGREVDLSQCEIEAEVVFTEELVDALVSMNSEVMAIGSSDDLEQSEEAPDVLIGAYSDGKDELGTVVLGEDAVGSPVSLSFNVSPQTRMLAIRAQAGDYPEFQVEYYANLNRPATEADHNAGKTLVTNTGAVSKRKDSLDFIDTDGGELPKNGTTPKTKNLMLDESGNVLFVNEPTQIFQAATMPYNSAEPEKMKTDNLGKVVSSDDVSLSIHYVLKEIRIYPNGSKDENGNEKTDYKSYTESEFNALEFTNSSKTAHDTGAVLITDDTVIRMVYDTKPDDEGHNVSALLFDYDITDGKKADGTYDSAANGINSIVEGFPETADSVKFAFGNSNAGTNYGDVKLQDGTQLNMTNAPGKGGSNGYAGCSFGLVNQYLSNDGTPNFNMSAPEVFGTTAQKGKYIYNGSLKFIQSGDTYTLSAVNGTGASSLENFGHPGKYNGKNGNKCIWTNNFWPMDAIYDKAPENNKGKDPKFGSKGNQYTFSNGKGNPPSDDGTDHNAYFGMSFAVTFTLQKEYVGPLEYYFYGDDDMWVFLDGKLVCDIGGVHSSVGEYVNLWDYIPEFRDSTESHRLEFFYTERGASGSTCWMQFTVPNMIPAPQSNVPTPEKNYLQIEKKVEGDESKKSVEYNFNLVIEGTGDEYILYKYSRNELTESGAPKLIDSSQKVQGNSKTGLNFTLKDGEYVLLYPLPSHATYKLTETSTAQNCTTTFQVNGGQAQIGTGCGGSMSNNQKTSVEILCTNSFYYQLPETGGSGISLYTWAGALLIAAGCLWYKKRYSQRGERDEAGCI